MNEDRLSRQPRGCRLFKDFIAPLLTISWVVAITALYLLELHHGLIQFLVSLVGGRGRS